MANTYSQIYIHIIFAVKYREALIHPSWEDQLYKYITGIIRNKGFPFQWQEGFGAFSYADSQLDIVIKYIQNQKEHHKKVNFQQEYLKFLIKYKVEYNPQYLFEWNE